MSLDEYLDHTVFHRARPFSREEFRTFMLSQSVAFPETIAVARDLAGTGRYRMMTINNESAERSEEHTSELQSRLHLVCRLLLEKKKKNKSTVYTLSY